jgi:hypothetical protein
MQKSFVKPDNTATITCPNCQLTKTIAVGQFRSTRHTIKARCTCGHSFPINLDFRKYYRKKTKLPGIYNPKKKGISNTQPKKTQLAGIYVMKSPDGGSYPVVVTNISLSGLQFTLLSRDGIEIGQQGRITFTLDDRKQTEIDKQVIVKSVSDNIIGCRFADNEALEHGLRFYLFP